MSYTKTTNFSAKDALESGNPDKIVKGSEINTEFNNIQTAINTLNSTVNGLGTGTTTISSISASTATVSASSYSSYYAAPNPGFVVIWFHGHANIAAARNGGQTRVLNSNVLYDDHGGSTNIPDTLHILSVGLGTS